jgi:hypothetical protein
MSSAGSDVSALSCPPERAPIAAVTPNRVSNRIAAFGRPAKAKIELVEPQFLEISAAGASDRYA